MSMASRIAVGQAEGTDLLVARRHEGDHLVVVQVDHAVHVGPQAQDLAVHLMAHRGCPLAPEDAAPRDVGDHQVLGLDLLQADALRLGVADAV